MINFLKTDFLNARIYATENINFNILMSIGDNKWDMENMPVKEFNERK